MCLLSQSLLLSLQQPELDPVTQAATKAELDRGIDKTTGFPVDGGCCALLEECNSVAVHSMAPEASQTQPNRSRQACTSLCPLYGVCQ